MTANTTELVNLFTTVAKTTETKYKLAEIHSALLVVAGEYSNLLEGEHLDSAPAPAKSFGDAVAKFLDLAQAMIDKYNMDHGFTFEMNKKLKAEFNKKYVKISKGGSVWAFIDKTNGDILKPASWKAPAMHARGNIYDANPIANCGPHGPNYLK